jgi:hypothetical protein
MMLGSTEGQKRFFSPGVNHLVVTQLADATFDSERVVVLFPATMLVFEASNVLAIASMEIGAWWSRRSVRTLFNGQGKD